MIRTFLLLGSNIGDRLQHLEDACTLLMKGNGKNEDGFKITSRSSVYETAAWGKIEQDDYLNQVLELEINLPPASLLGITSSIETKLGRVRKKIWEPRIIDIDILFYGDEIIREEKLIVPHPHLQNRRFALTPMAEIAPDFLHPVLKKDIKTLLQDCQDPLWVREYAVPVKW